MAAGKRGGEGFLGIGAVGPSEKLRCRRRAQGLAAAGKGQGMGAGVFLVSKAAIAAAPREGGMMFTHVDFLDPSPGWGKKFVSKPRPDHPEIAGVAFTEG